MFVVSWRSFYGNDTYVLEQNKRETQHSDLRLSALFKGGGPAIRLVVGSDSVILLPQWQ
jgi:hypothetical protein